MKIGILRIDNRASVSDLAPSVAAAARLLELKGHTVSALLSITEDMLAVPDTAERFQHGLEALLVCGNISVFRKYLAEKYTLPEKLNCFEINGTIYLLDETPSAEFLKRTAIPALNSKSKTVYSSVVLRTFGISVKKLGVKLEPCVRNKNRITMSFVDRGHGECEIRICFSKKTNDVDGFIKRVAETVKDHLFSLRDESLPEAVVGALKTSGKTVAAAESFTGGGVAKAIVSVAGASAVFKECVVSYSADSKINRLGVKKELIETRGAVSVDTAYEMAASVLLSAGCDYSVATTGNAGPAAEKEGQAGLFYIAVGSAAGIHVFKETIKSDRSGVIEYGINAALFRLYRFLISSVNPVSVPVNPNDISEKQ